MKIKIYFFQAICGFILLGCNSQKPRDSSLTGIPPFYYEKGNYAAHRAEETPTIDGMANEKDWDYVPWAEIKSVWIGEEPSKEDFRGRYKILWDEKALYFLLEIVDDSLSDQRVDPMDLWWEDDCPEIFVDEDNSKGDHMFNHSAFAYHITTNYDIVDLGPDHRPHLYNDHIEVKRTKNGKIYTWEAAVKVFDKNFNDTLPSPPVKLTEGKKMGFAISYNDNDGNRRRENMVSSIDVEGEDKNKGWIDAGVFGTLELLK